MNSADERENVVRGGVGLPLVEVRDSDRASDYDPSKPEGDNNSSGHTPEKYCIGKTPKEIAVLLI